MLPERGDDNRKRGACTLWSVVSIDAPIDDALEREVLSGAWSHG